MYIIDIMIGWKWSSISELGTISSNYALFEYYDRITNIDTYIWTSTRSVSQYSQGPTCGDNKWYDDTKLLPKGFLLKIICNGKYYVWADDCW